MSTNSNSYSYYLSKFRVLFDHFRKVCNDANKAELFHNIIYTFIDNIAAITKIVESYHSNCNSFGNSYSYDTILKFVHSQFLLPYGLKLKIVPILLQSQELLQYAIENCTSTVNSVSNNTGNYVMHSNSVDNRVENCKQRSADSYSVVDSSEHIFYSCYNSPINDRTIHTCATSNKITNSVVENSYSNNTHIHKVNTENKVTDNETFISINNNNNKKYNDSGKCSDSYSSNSTISNNFNNSNSNSNSNNNSSSSKNSSSNSSSTISTLWKGLLSWNSSKKVTPESRINTKEPIQKLDSTNFHNKTITNTKVTTIENPVTKCSETHTSYNDNKDSNYYSYNNDKKNIYDGSLDNYERFFTISNTIIDNLIDIKSINNINNQLEIVTENSSVVICSYNTMTNTVNIDNNNYGSNSNYSNINDKHGSNYKHTTINTNDINTTTQNSAYWIFSNRNNNILFKKSTDIKIKPLLIIGKLIKNNNSELAVDAVISVDVKHCYCNNYYRNYNCNSTYKCNNFSKDTCANTDNSADVDIVTNIMILLEGHWQYLYKNTTKSTISPYDYPIDDDSNSDDDDSDDEVSVDSSGNNKSRTNFPYNKTVKRQYYVIHAQEYNNRVVIINIQSIHSNIVLDQIPTSISILTNNISIIYGTNCLLGTVTSNSNYDGDCSKSINSNSHNDSKVQNESQRHSYNDDHNSVAVSTFISLTDDDEIVPEMNSRPSSPSTISSTTNNSINGIITTTQSHATWDTITAIKYYYNPIYTNNNTITLLSGDSSGCLCYWEITNNGTGRLIAKPLKLQHKIMSINCNKDYAIVALWDRLLLISLRSNTSKNYNSYENKDSTKNDWMLTFSTEELPNLIVTQYLDINNSTAIYSVTISITNILSIWKVVSTDKTISISFWKETLFPISYGDCNYNSNKSISSPNRIVTNTLQEEIRYSIRSTEIEQYEDLFPTISIAKVLNRKLTINTDITSDTYDNYINYRNSYDTNENNHSNNDADLLPPSPLNISLSSEREEEASFKIIQQNNNSYNKGNNNSNSNDTLNNCQKLNLLDYYTRQDSCESISEKRQLSRIVINICTQVHCNYQNKYLLYNLANSNNTQKLNSNVDISVHSKSYNYYDNRTITETEKFNQLLSNTILSRTIILKEVQKQFISILQERFEYENSTTFQYVKNVLVTICAVKKHSSLGLIAAALSVDIKIIKKMIEKYFKDIIYFDRDSNSNSDSNNNSNNTVTSNATNNSNSTNNSDSSNNSNSNSNSNNNNCNNSRNDEDLIIKFHKKYQLLPKWISSQEYFRIQKQHNFWLDISIGHTYLCALYLKFCGNKSVAIEHKWHDYLQSYGPIHLSYCSRYLRYFTSNIRKLDETANIQNFLPRQIGYIIGLQEIYARRVGLYGPIPSELEQLTQLRVLSMGNNFLSGNLPESLGNLKCLQRIVLHQNKLEGPVPSCLGKLGCIVNLAGNHGLVHGDDVPETERDALVALYHTTRGHRWLNNSNWTTKKPISQWYKVGVLSSHVHSIVMSSNGMNGYLPSTIINLKFLRMIELATMPELSGPLPKELFQLTTLRRLCICRCSLSGPIPLEIGNLVELEELQLFGNKLSGSIPHTICKLTKLKLLSLGEYTGGNNFIPAPLPTCLRSLTKLEALFMANCNIRHSLPHWIGELTELRQLDLQRNSISGNIPKSIGKLENLLYLNIKDNSNLGGQLPIEEITSLSNLNRLSLVHCNFQNTTEVLEKLKKQLPRCKIWL